MPWSWRARALKESGGATPRIARRTIRRTSRGSASTRATGGGTRGRLELLFLAHVNLSITIFEGERRVEVASQNPFLGH